MPSLLTGAGPLADLIAAEVARVAAYLDAAPGAMVLLDAALGDDLSARRGARRGGPGARGAARAGSVSDRARSVGKREREPRPRARRM